MKRILAIALVLLLCGLAWAEEDPVVVRVGAFSYPQSLVQSSLDSAVKVQEALTGEPLSEEERRQMVGDVIDNFVGIGLIETKLTEAGRYDFTAEEAETLNIAARNRYEELWQSLYRLMKAGDEEVTEAQVAQAMEEEGYTLDAVYRELEISERQHRAIELFVPDMMLTEDQLNEYYEDQFLAPDRERYANNIPLYEREILAANNGSFYTPEGYRYIRQILLEYPEEVEASLRPLQSKMEAAARKVAETYAALADAAAKAEDWSELDAPRAEYDGAVKALEAVSQAYAKQRSALTMPLIRDTLDEIDERLNEGIDFKTLISKYSADVSEQNVQGTGYPLHPDSEGWPADFIAAGMAMAKPGDVSKPVLTDKGVHILYYDSDIPAGDHVLTDDERQTLAASALYYYQTQALIARFEEWKPDYDIETHPELLHD